MNDFALSQIIEDFKKIEEGTGHGEVTVFFKNGFPYRTEVKESRIIENLTPIPPSFNGATSCDIAIKVDNLR